jgi:hypothetical protein
MAAVPAAVMHWPQGGTVATTLKQLYQDEASDPCKRNYTKIMQRFDASQDDAIVGATLLQQVVRHGGKTLQSYLCCGRSMSGPKIFALHLPSLFTGTFDSEATIWDDKCFAIKGDVVQGMVSVVNFPNDAFDTLEVRVKSLEYMLENLEELQAMPLFPAALDNEEETEIIRPRNFMFLPAAYASLLLRSTGYTALEVWEVLYPAMEQRQDLEICLPLLQWLQVASSSTVRANAQVGDPENVVTLMVPAADEKLLAHMHSVVHQILPGLSAPPASLESALAQMATALIAQTNDSRQAREQRLADKKAEKLPSDRFTVTLPVLMEYLQVEDERNLPEIWTRWSNCTKRQEMQVLRDALDAFARSPDAYSSSVPIVTARLTQDMLNFNFVGQSADDLKGGLHPFIIADGNAEHRQNNLEVARLYGLLTAGDATCSLADLEALSSKEVKSIPLTYWELDATIGMFGNLIGVILGVRHPLSAAFRQMWALMQSQLKTDLHTALEYRAYVKPAHLLRSIQLGFYNWFSHRRARLAPPQPDFTTTLQQIIMQNYVLPALPSQIYQLVYPKKSYQTTTVLPSLASISTSGTSLSSSNISTSTSSVVSGLTTQTGGSTIIPPGRGARIANLHPIPNIVSLVPSSTKLKDIIGTSTPPTYDSGADMCLSFLLKGGCWSNCKRAMHHTSSLSANEQQRLTQYLTRRVTATPGNNAPVPAPAIPGGHTPP